jgi:hypothetical protein
VEVAGDLMRARMLAARLQPVGASHPLVQIRDLDLPR